MERKYVTINEAADICGVARRTVYNWIAEGFLSPIKRTVSGSVRIDKTLLLIPRPRRQSNVYRENLHGKSDVHKVIKADGRDSREESKRL